MNYLCKPVDNGRDERVKMTRYTQFDIAVFRALFIIVFGNIVGLLYSILFEESLIQSKQVTLGCIIMVISTVLGILYFFYGTLLRYCKKHNIVIREWLIKNIRIGFYLLFGQLDKANAYSSEAYSTIKEPEE